MGGGGGLKANPSGSATGYIERKMDKSNYPADVQRRARNLKFGFDMSSH